MGQLKILFGVFQIVSTFLGTFSVEWPAAFEDFIDSIQFVNFGVFDVDSLTCNNPESNFYHKLVMQIFGPIGLALLLFGVAWLRIRHAVGKYGVAKAAKKKITIENQVPRDACHLALDNFARYKFIHLPQCMPRPESSCAAHVCVLVPAFCPVRGRVDDYHEVLQVH